MKKFVEISSNQTIKVYSGLQTLDATNIKAPVKDRLNVKPAWTQLDILIKQGIHYYPALIKEWPAVKNLAKDQIISIGAETDSCPMEQAEVEKELVRLQNAYTKLDSDTKKNEEVMKRLNETKDE